MKGLRLTALGLAVVACLLIAAPAAQADPEGRWTADRSAVTSPAWWFAGWWERVAAWLGLGPEPT
ncbi:MAG: hypothetical protein ACRDHY_15455, partial [Anaerolineales bacterium]